MFSGFTWTGAWPAAQDKKASSVKVALKNLKKPHFIKQRRKEQRRRLG